MTKSDWVVVAIGVVLMSLYFVVSTIIMDRQIDAAVRATECAPYGTAICTRHHHRV